MLKMRNLSLGKFYLPEELKFCKNCFIDCGKLVLVFCLSSRKYNLTGCSLNCLNIIGVLSAGVGTNGTSNAVPPPGQPPAPVLLQRRGSVYGANVPMITGELNQLLNP